MRTDRQCRPDSATASAAYSHAKDPGLPSRRRRRSRGRAATIWGAFLVAMTPQDRSSCTVAVGIWSIVGIADYLRVYERKKSRQHEELR